MVALQERFAAALGGVLGAALRFEPVTWQRDGGRHGGGRRLVAATGPLQRASLNVSAVHYDDLPDRRLSSATSLSCIVHPEHPRGPSIHMHVSWTELRDATGYWRVMADLNPSIEDPAATARFTAALREASGALYERARAQGDRYFHIPALGRARGASHFYLEQHRTADPAADLALAEGVGTAAIDAYAELLAQALAGPAPTQAERALQLAYHTLYAFQVLTLDRGTSSGLLVHSDNDVGILGSLPARVDRDLLASWRDRVPEPQGALVDDIVAALLPRVPSPIGDAQKRALAAVLRAFYATHPQALALQARGDVLPPTVANHR